MGLHRHHLALILAGLTACGGPPEPAAPEAPAIEAKAPTPTLPEPPAKPVQRHHGPTIYERVLRLPGDVIVGTRIHADDTVATASGVGDAPTWTDRGTLTPGDRALVDELLGSDEAARLPRRLPPTAVDPGAPHGLVRMTLPAGERLVELADARAVKVPLFDRIEALAKASVETAPSHATFEIRQGDRTVAFEAPCHPLRTAGLRPMVAPLVSRDLPAASAERLPEPWLVVKWNEGQDGHVVSLGKDRRIARTGPGGDTEVFQLPPEAMDRVEAAVSATSWATLAERCDTAAPTPAPEPTPPG